jgi:DNA-binding GntR family transcriptional regulator
MEDALEPLASRQLKDEAYAAIKDAITSLRFQPGEAIMEHQLARSLGISKTPIRMALVRLEQEGFVETRRASGTFVRRMTLSDVGELFDVREALEQLAVRLLAGNLRPEQVQRLRENIEQERTLIEAGAQERAFDAVNDFHRLLVDFVENRWLLQSYHVLFDHIVRIGNVCGRIPGRNQQSVGEHAALVDALAAGQQATASALISAHLRGLLDDYRAAAIGSPLLEPMAVAHD